MFTGEDLLENMNEHMVDTFCLKVPAGRLQVITMGLHSKSFLLININMKIEFKRGKSLWNSESWSM